MPADRAPASTSRTDWRVIADRLAPRLIHHAYCETHERITEDCPFCDDIAAFEAYQKAGGTMRTPSIDGPTIAVQDVRYGSSSGSLVEDCGRCRLATGNLRRASGDPEATSPCVEHSGLQNGRSDR